MTHAQLIKIAKHHGFVRWTRSQVVERLYWNGAQVIAVRPLSKRRTTIFPRVDHWCTELDPKTPVALGDMI